MRPVPKSIQITIDSREKVPLLFPSNIIWYRDRGYGEGHLVKVKTKVAKLDYGDYLLSNWPNAAVIERKGSLDELNQNLLTDDYERFMSATRRLCENCRHPYLLLDTSIATLWTPTERCPSPERAWDALCQILSTFGVRLLWGGNAKHAGPRRILGEQILRILLSHALREDS